MFCFCLNAFHINRTIWVNFIKKAEVGVLIRSQKYVLNSGQWSSGLPQAGVQRVL